MKMHTWDVYEVSRQGKVCQCVVYGPSFRTELPKWPLFNLSSSKLAIWLTVVRLPSESLKIKGDYREIEKIEHSD